MNKKVTLMVLLWAGGGFAQTTVNGSRTYVGNLRVRYPNNAVTGTMLHRLAKLTGSPATAVQSDAGDTGEAVGIVMAVAGASGEAEIAFTGKASCEFDGGVTAGNYVQISQTLAGACHDAGSATLPPSGQVIGRVTATNAMAGTYEVDLTARTNYPASSIPAAISGSLRLLYANESTTGTALNRLAKLTGAPSTAIVTATSDSIGAIGIVAAGAGTSGNAEIAFTGKANCDFDGPATAGHYVQISSTAAGKCRDAGASLPGSGQVIGIVTVTNGSAGINEVDLTSRAILPEPSNLLIQDEGSDLPQRTILNFAGVGISCADSPTTTTCTVSGGGGGGGGGDFSTNTSTSVANEIVLFSDTGGKTGKRSTGTGYAFLTNGVLAPTTVPHAFGVVIDGSGSPIATGFAGYATVPYACTINGYSIEAAPSGSISVEVHKKAAALPVMPVTDKICASACPALSSSQLVQSSTLTGWNTAVAANDVVGFWVTAATSVEWARISINCTTP